jgi:signal transduction histidine kinase
MAKEVPVMHVLLVEDDPDDRDIVSEFLSATERRVFSLETADTLSTGLERLSTETVDVVLLDLFLPDGDGLDTFTQLHSRFPNVPIVILTVLNDAEVATRAVRDGAQDYLCKEDLSAELLIRTLRYSAERMKASEQLRQAQKMAAVGQLAGGVAHDFNNLLSVILGNAEILQGGGVPAEIASRALARIHQAAKSAASLTAQLLAFGRRQALNPVVLNLDEVVTKAEKLLRHLIGENIELVARSAAQLGHVRADPGQLEQVILNLAINARDAMPHGGALTIEAENAELDEGYLTSAEPVEPGPYVMLAVSDTGIGMDAEAQTHIFEPFYTTKALGSGLGLATVYGIVRQSGGHISVYSRPGRGTTIKVFLPLVQEQVENSTPGDAWGESLGGWETILLVEDNADLREVGREFLVGNGYTVLEAGSCDEALSVARNHRGPIHLLLTDVVLPTKSGPEVAAQVKALCPEVAVLYMSGYTNDVIARHGILEPGSVLLEKPFTRKQLFSLVRETLDTRKIRTARGAA